MENCLGIIFLEISFQLHELMFSELISQKCLAGGGSKMLQTYKTRHRPKGVFGKGVGNSKNASGMRQKCVKMCLVLLGKESRSKTRQKCVKIVSKMRGTLLGENTFGGEHLWTIPIDRQALLPPQRPSPVILFLHLLVREENP